MNKRFADLITASIKNRFSDIHISGGHPLIFRRDGRIHADGRPSRVLNDALIEKVYGCKVPVSRVPDQPFVLVQSLVQVQLLQKM